MNPKQRREIKDWYTDLALGRTIKAEDIERPAAELARREQAAGVAGCHSCGFSFRVTNTTSLEKGECAKCGADWPLHGKREQAQAPQPENLHPAEIRLATLRPKLADAEDALNKERAENARLRSLLAAANHYCDVYCNSMDSAAIEAAHDAMIEAAQEAIK